VDSFKLQWIYRGQACSEWELASSLERSPFLLGIDPAIETTLVAEYRRVFPSMAGSHQQPNSTLEWLAFLQHHGTPTRLIDFTRSPYIAAYFAFQEEHDEEDGRVAIWCLDKIRFYQAAIYLLKEEFGIAMWNKRNYFFTSDAFEDLFDHEVACVMPFELPRLNERQLGQQAVFLAAMSPGTPLAGQLSFLDRQKKPIMNKVTIPRSERKTALRDLMKMNVTHATLFPGFDGFSRSLYLRYSTLAKVGETAEWIKELGMDGFA